MGASVSEFEDDVGRLMRCEGGGNLESKCRLVMQEKENNHKSTLGM